MNMIRYFTPQQAREWGAYIRWASAAHVSRGVGFATSLAPGRLVPRLPSHCAQFVTLEFPLAECELESLVDLINMREVKKWENLIASRWRKPQLVFRPRVMIWPLLLTSSCENYKHATHQQNRLYFTHRKRSTIVYTTLGSQASQLSSYSKIARLKRWNTITRDKGNKN